jgi:hypothetical protein
MTSRLLIGPLYYLPLFPEVIDVRGLDCDGLIRRLVSGNISLFSTSIYSVHPKIRSRCSIEHLKSFPLAIRVKALVQEFGKDRVVEMLLAEDRGRDPNVYPLQRHQNDADRLLRSLVGFSSLKTLETADDALRTSIAYSLLNHDRHKRVWAILGKPNFEWEVLLGK